MKAHRLGTGEKGFAVATLASADWLRFAAAPTFGAMALLTAVHGDGHQVMLCSQGASPLSGMTWMYTLMGMFHSAPWLKLIASPRRSCRS